MILGRLGEPARPVDPVQQLLKPLLMCAAVMAAARYPRLPQRFVHSSVRRRVPQARGVSRKVPGRPDGPPLFVSERGRGFLRQKDLGHDNDTVPQEYPDSARFADEHPIQRGGTRCATKPNTFMAQGIPSQPSVSCGKEKATIP
jgi:hypothetical protein